MAIRVVHAFSNLMALADRKHSRDATGMEEYNVTSSNGDPESDPGWLNTINTIMIVSSHLEQRGEG